MVGTMCYNSKRWVFHRSVKGAVEYSCRSDGGSVLKKRRVVDRAGFEPATGSLSISCSPTELPAHYYSEPCL